MRWAMVVGVLLMVSVAFCSGATLVPAQSDMRASGKGDTLTASPWVHALLASWNADSLSTPRFFCVTSYAKWPAFYYLRHLSVRGSDVNCEIVGTPLLIQALACPPMLRFTRPTHADWILVQCGPDYYQGYSGRGAVLPQTGGGQV